MTAGLTLSSRCAGAVWASSPRSTVTGLASCLLAWVFFPPAVHIHSTERQLCSYEGLCRPRCLTCKREPSSGTAPPFLPHRLPATHRTAPKSFTNGFVTKPCTASRIKPGPQPGSAISTSWRAGILLACSMSRSHSKRKVGERKWQRGLAKRKTGKCREGVMRQDSRMAPAVCAATHGQGIVAKGHPTQTGLAV